MSPNAVYFSTALVVAAVLIVPNLPAVIIGAFLCVGALASLGYLAHTKVHQQWRRSNLPVMDWIWFVGLPIVSYVLLLLSGVGFLFQVALSMHGVAGALILLLVIGIRNAWDLVIWMAQQERK